MSGLVKVDGHPHLARDKQTGAVVNINRKSIEDARQAKKNRLAKDQRLDNLENEVSEIKNLLKQLVDKNG